MTHQPPELEHHGSGTEPHILEPADPDSLEPDDTVSSGSDSSPCTSPAQSPHPHPPNEQTCDSVLASEEDKCREVVLEEHPADRLAGAATRDGLTRTERELDKLIAELRGTSLTTGDTVITTDQDRRTADDSVQRRNHTQASSGHGHVASKENGRVVSDSHPRERVRRGKHGRGAKARDGREQQTKPQSRLLYYGMGAGRLLNSSL